MIFVIKENGKFLKKSPTIMKIQMTLQQGKLSLSI